MKWFAIYGTALVLCVSVAQAEPSQREPLVSVSACEKAVAAQPSSEGMSYPSLTFGRTLPSRQVNALRIDSTASIDAAETATVLRTHRIIHIIGAELE